MDRDSACTPTKHPLPSSSPQFVSLLSIHYFKHPMTTSFNLKERGILKTTSDPPPTPGILNHPPNTHPPKATSLFSLNLSVTSSPSWRRRGLIGIVLNPNPSHMHQFQSGAAPWCQTRWGHLWVLENKCHVKIIQIHEDACTYFVHLAFKYMHV